MNVMLNRRLKHSAGVPSNFTPTLPSPPPPILPWLPLAAGRPARSLSDILASARMRQLSMQGAQKAADCAAPTLSQPASLCCRFELLVLLYNSLCGVVVKRRLYLGDLCKKRQAALPVCFAFGSVFRRCSEEINVPTREFAAKVSQACYELHWHSS